MADMVKKAGLGCCVLLGRVFRPRGLPWLTYHSIDDSGSYMSTSPAMFRAQMDWLRAHDMRAISVATLFAELDAGRPWPRNTVVLTFDDGLENVARVAWPVMRAAGFGATVFVPTDFIGGDAAWYRDYDLPVMRCMDWDTLRAVAREGADVQSHGASHRSLPELADGDLQHELRQSRAILEQGLGAPVQHLAYPFGAADARTAAAAAAAGYRSACVLGDGLHQPGGDDFRIRRESLDRIAIRDARTARLSMAACCAGTYSWYVRAKRGVRGLYATPPHLAQTRTP